jgi:hypothetical protein
MKRIVVATSALALGALVSGTLAQAKGCLKGGGRWGCRGPHGRAWESWGGSWMRSRAQQGQQRWPR